MRDRPVPWLVAAVDAPRLAREDVLTRLEALLAAGCPAVLLRGGGLPARRLGDLAGAAAARCQAHGAELWIGDRADIARACGADAVQLPARGLSEAGARRVVSSAMRVGRSVHSVAEARAAAAAGADHLIVGTIFATASHPGARPAGPGLLTTIAAALADGAAECGAAASPPLLAIGGLTPETAAAVRAAGAHGLVAVRALWDAADPAAAVAAFRAAFRVPFGRGPADALHSPS